jgi:hypothetical protein
MMETVQQLTAFAAKLDQAGFISLAGDVDSAMTAIVMVGKELGGQGYWVRNQRCWQGCYRQKRASAPRTPAQRIWTQCLDEYQEAIKGKNASWDKYANSQSTIKVGSQKQDRELLASLIREGSSGSEAANFIFASTDNALRKFGSAYLDAAEELSKVAESLSNSNLELSKEANEIVEKMLKEAAPWNNGFGRAIKDKAKEMWNNPSGQPQGPGAGQGLKGRMQGYQEQDRQKQMQDLQNKSNQYNQTYQKPGTPPAAPGATAPGAAPTTATPPTAGSTPPAAASGTGAAPADASGATGGQSGQIMTQIDTLIGQAEQTFQSWMNQRDQLVQLSKSQGLPPEVPQAMAGLKQWNNQTAEKIRAQIKQLEGKPPATSGAPTPPPAAASTPGGTGGAAAGPKSEASDPASPARLSDAELQKKYVGDKPLDEPDETAADGELRRQQPGEQVQQNSDPNHPFAGHEDILQALPTANTQQQKQLDELLKAASGKRRLFNLWKSAARQISRSPVSSIEQSGNPATVPTSAPAVQNAVTPAGNDAEKIQNISKRMNGWGIKSLEQHIQFLKDKPEQADLVKKLQDRLNQKQQAKQNGAPDVAQPATDAPQSATLPPTDTTAPAEAPTTSTLPEIPTEAPTADAPSPAPDATNPTGVQQTQSPDKEQNLFLKTDPSNFGPDFSKNFGILPKETQERLMPQIRASLGLTPGGAKPAAPMDDDDFVPIPMRKEDSNKKGKKTASVKTVFKLV